jgi:hypothetical protein
MTGHGNPPDKPAVETRRLLCQTGKPQAVTATAHKLARIIYAMLKSKQPYKDPGADHLEAQVQERKLKQLQRQAKELGYELIAQHPLGRQRALSTTCSALRPADPSAQDAGA